MATGAEDALLREIATRLGRLAFSKVQNKIGSSTLRQALELIIERTGDQGYQSRLFIPHYWAVYYHDGRSAFGPAGSEFLVFFAHPSDDPRLSGGYPVRANDLRRLTAAEFKHGLEENRARALRGDAPFMFVVKHVGPAKAHPFFTDGMVGFETQADGAAFELVDGFMLRLVDEIGNDSGTASFTL